MEQSNLYEFYLSVLSKNGLTRESLDKFPFIKSRLLKLSDIFSVQSKDNKNELSNISNIVVLRRFIIDQHHENYLFKYFMKNHFSLLEFASKFETIKDMEVTDLEIRDSIVNRFMNCLRENSITNPRNDHLTKLSDYELIKSLCAKERLTYYNYLNEKAVMSRKQIKNHLNKHYIQLILNTNRPVNLESAPKTSLEDLVEVYQVKI